MGDGSRIDSISYIHNFNDTYPITTLITTNLDIGRIPLAEVVN
jgi:hypothetical protein